MNKAELIDFISKENGCTKIDAEKTINMFTSAISAVLSQGNSVNLVGFGSFGVSSRPARVGRNPKTGEVINIKAYNLPKFKAGQTLKNSCN